MTETVKSPSLNLSDNSIKALFTVLGVISGIPLAFSGSMIQMWLTDFDISLKLIGSLTLLSLPYGLKFLWTPWLEAYYKGSDPYRFWMIVTCALMSLSLMVLSLLNPIEHVYTIISITMLFAFLSASFDSMLDGYRLARIPENKMGLTTSCYVIGYRVGLLFTGGLGAIIADPNHFGFNFFYRCAFLVLLAGTLFVINIPSITNSALKHTPQKKKNGIVRELKESFHEMLTIPGVMYLIGIIMTYRFCDTLLAALSTNYFQNELGYSLSTLGIAYKMSGLVATIVGAFIGGLWLDKKGVFSLLNKICLIQGLANFSYLYLYFSERTVVDLFIVVWIEHFCGGLANSACVVLLSSIAMKIEYNKATAYALLSALFVPARVISGFIAASLVTSYGWPFFIIFSSSVIVIPMSLVYLYLKKIEQESTPTNHLINQSPYQAN